MTSARVRPVAWTLFAGLLLASTSAHAQAPPSGNTGALIAAAHGNPQQTSTAAYIGALCPNLTPGTDLRLRCAGALSAAVNAPPLATNALGWITPEELLSQSGAVDGVVPPGTAAIAGRLSALGRVGFRSGLAAAYRPVVLAANGDTAGLGGVGASRLQGFVNVVAGHGNKDANVYDTGYDFDDRSITGGGDFRFTDAFTGGGALSYGDTDLDFKAGGGTMQVRTFGGSLYGLWTVDEHIQVSALVGYTHVRNTSDRYISYVESATTTINRVAHSRVTGHQWEGTVTVSYAMTGADGWSFGPSLALSGQKLNLHAFDETGANGLNLSFPKQDTDSLQIILGFDASKAISTSAGVITPYARAQGIYETRDNSRTVQVRYTADTTGFFPGIRLTTRAPDRSRFLLGGGLAGQFTNGWSAFADIETIVGLREVSGYNATLGVRKEF
jgi:uncharacterized protein YhjY with autotransporter beta-barrel domain